MRSGRVRSIFGKDRYNALRLLYAAHRPHALPLRVPQLAPPFCRRFSAGLRSAGRYRLAYESLRRLDGG